ncbi:hypothetical protein GGF46_002825 [Coemansia sp. RSA 552]|nr:hypothetical protein GGF46_002825 [Coemansia sp. RSA 552]
MGSRFLANLYEDACQWTSADSGLRARIVQYLIRALFAEGHGVRATELYEGIVSAGYVCGYHGYSVSPTPEILCEVVSGLCQCLQLDQARDFLMSSARQCRNSFVWNAYFDGLISCAIRARSGQRRASASDPGAVLETLQQAMHHMESVDGIAPDPGTRSIWLRACFRFGGWKVASRYFWDNLEALRSDAVCWDIFLREAAGSNDPEAQRAGWQLIDELVQWPDSQCLDVDARLLETILQHVLRHFAAPRTDSMYVPEEEAVKRAFAWVKAWIPLARHTAFAVVIQSLLKTGQIHSALELHRTMCTSGLSPSKPINCMLVKAIAAYSNNGIASAAQFIKAGVPRQHFLDVYFVLLKAVAQQGNYDEMWNILDKQYPKIVVASTEKWPQFAAPYPDARMYQNVLLLTKESGEYRQHRLLLDRMQCHLGLIGAQFPAAAHRMLKVYDYFRTRQ